MSTNPSLTNREKRLNRVLSMFSWLFIGAGLLSLLLFYWSSRTQVRTNDAQVRQYITPVASKVEGFITQIHFVENQYVKKGDTLVVIDRREYQNEVDRAKADLATTEQAVATYESNVSTHASNADIVKAEIEAAKIEVWRTEQDYTRFKNLVTTDAATQQQFEHAEAKYRQAKANLLALNKRESSVLIGTYAEQTKVAPAKTQVAQRKAILNDALLDLSYTYVIAPYDGWVGTKNIQEGQLVKAGQALVQCVSEEKWIVANYKETQIGQIDLEGEIEIEADAYADLIFTGEVESLSPASGSEFALVKPDNATGNFVKIEQRFPVKIRLKANPDNDKLRSGMNVIVSAKKRD